MIPIWIPNQIPMMRLLFRTDNSMSTITSYHINDEDTNHDRGTRVVVATTKYG